MLGGNRSRDYNSNKQIKKVRRRITVFLNWLNFQSLLEWILKIDFLLYSCNSITNICYINKEVGINWKLKKWFATAIVAVISWFFLCLHDYNTTTIEVALVVFDCNSPQYQGSYQWSWCDCDCDHKHNCYENK